MNLNEASVVFQNLSEEHRAITLERLSLSLTSYARRYYRGRAIPDGSSLAQLNEILHSIAGYQIQMRGTPAAIDTHLFFQTLDEKTNDSELKARIVSALETCFAQNGVHAIV